MSFQTIWTDTNLPKDVINSLEKDLSENFDQHLEPSQLMGGVVDSDRRNSKNTWISTEHWIAGFIWHYVQKANRENFLYDLRNIDNESIQYTHYGLGEYYKWHIDAGIATCNSPIGGVVNGKFRPGEDYINENCELIRKLSFVLQLSDSDEYTGGNLQLIDEADKCYFAPRKKGTIILFDSRTRHRVLKVKSGLRKSLVGWVVGPRWR